MAEWTAINSQIIPPGETVTFTTTVIQCTTGNIRHADGTGTFLLRGNDRTKCCCNQVTMYNASFGANIAVPTGETVGEISVAIAVDGNTLPATVMKSTPADVEEFNAVSKTTSIGIWNGCCQTVSVRNTSSIPIEMTEAILNISL